MYNRRIPVSSSLDGRPPAVWVQRISPDMALRLSKTVGRSAESRVAMQDANDLWQAHREVSLDRVQRLEVAASEQTLRLVTLRAEL